MVDQDKYQAAKRELYDGFNQLIADVQKKYEIVPDDVSRRHTNTLIGDVVTELLFSFPEKK